MDPNIVKQLQVVQSNQQTILQCNAKTLIDSSRHYQQQYMPGAAQQSIFLPNQNYTPDVNDKALPQLNEVTMNVEELICNNSNATEKNGSNSKSKKKVRDLATSNSTHFLGFNLLDEIIGNVSNDDNVDTLENLFDLNNPNEDDEQLVSEQNNHKANNNVPVITTEEHKICSSNAEQQQKNSGLQEYMKKKEAYEKQLKASVRQGQGSENKKHEQMLSAKKSDKMESSEEKKRRNE